MISTCPLWTARRWLRRPGTCGWVSQTGTLWDFLKEPGNCRTCRSPFCNTSTRSPAHWKSTQAGVGSTERSVVRRAQIATEAQKSLEPLLKEIGQKLDQARLEPDMLLALIAELAQRHIEDDGESDVSIPLNAENEA